ncbi:hypothetical protein [Absidia glauca]|uniref:Ndc10 domain-containing protein n=1 Tax=Absidia glauca TaxID=4829 RepID=A0A168P6W6_ABSGL|nr:hypothetical protein [Absidia glauca]
MLQTEPPGQNQSVYSRPVRHKNGLTLLTGNRSAGPSLLLVSGPTKRHISLAAHQPVMAGDVCANVDQIRRQGRWNNTSINGAYLTNLPRKLVRSMAGLPPWVRFFYLARAALNPPYQPLQEVVPGDRRDQLAAKELSPGDPIQPVVAENAFVPVIIMFRKTFTV